MTFAMPHLIIDQLHSALQNGRLPARQTALGATILDHLSEAVSVVVLGRPGSGKSSLINMMMGQDLISPPPGVELCEVVFGPTAQVTLSWPDGATRRFSGARLPAAEGAGATAARYELPLEALKSYDFCEIAQPTDPARQRSLLDVALAKGQVFVWCSEGFDASEQQIWHSLPEAVKDHSFLALTKADRQIMKGDLSERIADLEAVAADEFLGLHPIATLHGLKARAGETFQSDLWQASGGRDLLDAVQAQVTKGRAADLDQAAMLLAQLGEREPAAPSAPFASQAPSTSSPAQEQRDSAHALDQQADLLEALQTQLQTAAQEMLADLNDGKIPDADGVVARCSSALRALSDLLSDADADGATDTACLLEDARDGEETLTLLQVEQNPGSAEDAVVLLLQLKKEIGARVAV